MNTKLKTDPCHDKDENKHQQELKELIQLIEENNVKNVESWLKNYNDSETIVCGVHLYTVCIYTV